MRPGELIGFMPLCAIAFIVFIICLIIFRRRMKIAGVIGIMLVLALTGYYLYFPTLQEKRYEANYEVLKAYLAKEYPDIELYIDKPSLEEGAYVNEFQVNRLDSPNQGVIYHVHKDEVEQFGHWSNESYPDVPSQVWRQVIATDFRDLDEPPIHVEMIDQYEEGELVAFALQVDGKPTIAIFNYSKEALSLQTEQQGNAGEIVEVMWGEHTFKYVPSDHTGELSSIMMKGKLHVH